MLTTLEKAFEKTFSLIFEKGTTIIEKTYDRSEIVNQYEISAYADDILGTRDSLRAFSKNAKRSTGKNLVFSGLSGMGMGFLGMGLPDIPIFTGLLLKSIYEIALHYGYDYNTPEERYFILLLIEGALSWGEHFEVVEDKINDFLRNPRLSESYDRTVQIEDASRALSKGLIYAKFLQGIPVVGVIGGSFDCIVIKQVTDYVKMKYYKRFLLNRYTDLTRK